MSAIQMVNTTIALHASHLRPPQAKAGMSTSEDVPSPCLCYPASACIRQAGWASLCAPLLVMPLQDGAPATWHCTKGERVWSFRWGWFVIGCFFMVAVFVSLFADGAQAVQRRDSSLLAFYNSTVLGLVVLWTLYPIVWALGEGTNYITSDAEVGLPPWPVCSSLARAYLLMLPNAHYAPAKW